MLNEIVQPDAGLAPNNTSWLSRVFITQGHRHAADLMTSEAIGGALPEATGGALPEAIGEALGGANGELGGGAIRTSPLTESDGKGNCGASHRKWAVSFEDTSS